MSVIFVAEAGSNFNGSLERAIRLVYKAQEIGADFVKFQLFDADLYAPEFVEKRKQMSEWSLPREFVPEIRKRCDEVGIKLMVTPFSVSAVDFLVDYVDALKIGSYELLYLPLIKKVAKSGKPWVMSTGMLDNNEIRTIILGVAKPDYLLFCNASYPALPKNCNISRIETFNPYYDDIKVGWSDHTTEPGVLYKAISLGVSMIECHFDLPDMQGYESQIADHVWHPDKLAEVIRNVRVGEQAMYSVDTGEDEAKRWRMGQDGHRPLEQYRKELLEQENG